MSASSQPPFVFLQPGEPFPSLGAVSESLGPLAVGGDLSVTTLLAAYQRGIFPWYSTPPILWWSPDPRMVLYVDEFRLHRSLRKTIFRLLAQHRLEIRVDVSFATVLRHCARIYRPGQSGTWINHDMQSAYLQFHEAGFAHSVETWLDGELVGGLYFINIGQAVFGESMFALCTDASKIALAALIAMCLQFKIPWVDCQQNTQHLTSLGGREMPRTEFIAGLAAMTAEHAPHWVFDQRHWALLDKTFIQVATPIAIQA